MGIASDYVSCTYAMYDICKTCNKCNEKVWTKLLNQHREAGILLTQKAVLLFVPTFTFINNATISRTLCCGMENVFIDP